MDTHDEATHSNHVVGVREADESHCGEVMDKHDQEVLKRSDKEDKQGFKGNLLLFSLFLL